MSGGTLVCLDSGFPETPRPSGSSAMESGCGERRGPKPRCVVGSAAVPAGSVLPPTTACPRGGAHPSPAKWQGSQLILRPESGEGPDRPGPCGQGSAL